MKSDNVQVSPDIYALGLIFKAMVVIPFFLLASLFLMKFIDIISRRLGSLIRYLAFPGVVLHEVCHDLFCRVTGVPILEHRLFIRTQNGGPGGVIIDAGKIRSFTSGFLVGFAPLMILALALYLLITFWAILPMQEGLKYYFGFCFFIGLSPCRADVSLVLSVARERPGQTLLELGLLFIPLLTGFAYLRLCSIGFTTFSIWLFVGAILGGALLAILTWRLVKRHRNS